MTGKDKYFYFVDGHKFETDSSALTGAQIKASVPGLDPSYLLFLESVGADPDQLIADSQTMSLEKEKGPKRFYTTPPATFG